MNKRLKFMWDTRKKRKEQKYYLVNIVLIIDGKKHTITNLHISSKDYPDFSAEAVYFHVKDSIEEKADINNLKIFISNFQEISYQEWKSFIMQRQLQDGSTVKEARKMIYKHLQKYAIDSPLYKQEDLKKKMEN